MTDVQTPVDELVVDCIYEAKCPSLSGRSNLTFQLGRSEGASGLRFHLRIFANSGKGMFNKDWVEGDHIDAVVRESPELTSRSFQTLLPGKSINNGGFFCAALRHLGLIRVKTENSRLHELVPTMTFKQVVMGAGQEKPAAEQPKPSRRKTKET